ncbi:MAG: hypothetical protein ACJ748_06760, partial [Flavisolibacter sp.]
MKLFYILISFISFNISGSIYDLEVNALDGTTIKLSDYSGTKLIIYEFNPVQLDTIQLRYLDSIQNSNQSIHVLAVPAIEFGTVGDSVLQNSIFGLNLSYKFLQPLAVQKSSLNNQSSLFKWITDVNLNSHFDHEVTNPGEFFIISEKGTLYGIINSNTSTDIINDVINQNLN